MRRYLLLFLITPFFALAQPEELSQDAKVKAETALIDGERHLILENRVKALEMFFTSRDINPNNSAVHFKIAEILYGTKDYDQALGSIKRAIELNSRNEFYFLLAADIQTARSDLLGAQGYYEELIKLPGTQDYIPDLALIYAHQGKFKKALETFDAAREHFGVNELIVQEKFKVCQLMGQPELAIPDWEELVKEYPGESAYQYTLIDLLITTGDLTKAERILNELLNVPGENARASLMMADVKKRQGKNSETLVHARPALLSDDLEFKLKGKILTDLLLSSGGEDKSALRDLVREVVALHPTDYTAQAFAGDLLFQIGEKEESIRYYLKATEINADNFSVWQNILGMESELGRWDDLAAHADRALEYFPNQGALYYFGGTAYLMKKEYQRSATLLEMGKRYARDPKLLSVFNGQLGDAYKGLKNDTKSDQAYEAALEADQSNEHVLNNYSFYLSLRKTNLDKALEMSSRLIKLNPNSATYLDTHGWVLFNLEKYKDAKKYLQKAVEFSSPGAAILEHYGDVLFKLGDTAGALEQWEQAVSKGGNHALLHKKIADKKYYE